MSAFAYSARSCALVLCLVASPSLDCAAAAEQGAKEAILERVRTDLAQTQGIAPSAIRTVSVREATWRDTSLDCGKPNESYAQVDVEGWRIALEHNGERFD